MINRQVFQITVFNAFLCVIPGAAVFACEEGYDRTPVYFTGQVKAGEAFQYEISPHFYLADNGQKKVTRKPVHPTFLFLKPNDHGWMLSIGPDAERDYIYPFNPPYRFNPLQYLDGSYDQQTLKYDEREFKFAVDLNDNEYMMMKVALNRVLWPQTDNDQKKGLDDLQIFELGQGVFTILNGTAEPPKSSSGDQTETVTSLQFKVDLQVPTYVTSCPAPSQSR